jgi:hypothetical protein
MLSVALFDDRAEVSVLRACEIRWSVDATVWRTLGEHAAGSVVVDHDAPGGRRRSYMALGEGGEQLIYYSPGAVRAFAELMEPWVGGSRG